MEWRGDTVCYVLYTVYCVLVRWNTSTRTRIEVILATTPKWTSMGNHSLRSCHVRFSHTGGRARSWGRGPKHRRQNCVGRREPHNLKPLRLKSIPFCFPYVSNAWTPRQRQLQSGHTSKRTEQKDYDFTMAKVIVKWWCHIYDGTIPSYSYIRTLYRMGRL